MSHPVGQTRVVQVLEPYVMPTLDVGFQSHQLADAKVTFRFHLAALGLGVINLNHGNVVYIILSTSYHLQRVGWSLGPLRRRSAR
jgi:hypothetical protein